MKRALFALLLLTSCLSPLPVLGQQSVVAETNVWVSEEAGHIVQVEPVIAVNPTNPDHMMAAAIGLRSPFASDWQDHQTILAYRSEDAGLSWTPVAIPGLPDSWTAADPWLTWVDSETVMLSAMAGTSITQRIGEALAPRVFRSNDGGRTWMSTRLTPFPANTAQDHPVLAHGGGQPLVLLAGSHATPEGDGVDLAWVSLDREAPETVPPLRPAIARVSLGGAVVRDGGEIVVSFFSMLPPRSLWSAKLDTRTGSWLLSRIRESVLPVGFPPLGVDESSGRFAGRVYSVWVEGEDQADMRVMLAWSDDAGSSWSTPTRVDSDSSRAVRTLPAVAVAPDGAVGVVWQDRRYASGSPCTDLLGAVSLDGGRSFLPDVRISSETACFSAEGSGAAAGRFRLGGGDYLGLAPIGPGAFQAVWSDGRTGRFQVWTAAIRVVASG